MSVQANDSTLEINTLSENIGAEVRGLDLRAPIDDATRGQLVNALIENVALVIRDQDFTPQQFHAAAQLFGETMADQDRRFRLPEVPQIRAVSSRHNDRTGKRVKVGERWHSDHTNLRRPPKFTTLYAVELPETGGDTNLANMRAAYAALPDDLRERLDCMKTINVYVGSAVKGYNADLIAVQKEDKPEAVEQPLVRTHPDNATKALYFHPSKVENIVGMSPEDSQIFLDDLLERTIQPAYVYTHTWRRGDMLIWDNRSAMHKANFDYDPERQPRVLYRILIRGDRPI